MQGDVCRLPYEHWCFLIFEVTREVLLSRPNLAYDADRYYSYLDEALSLGTFT